MSRPTRADPGGRAYLDLQNLARRQGRFTQELLTMYALERFLARLAASKHAGTFVLKGGMLLAVLAARRATVDADFLATSLVNEEAAVLERVVEIASIVPDVDDGVRYAVGTARARTIREGALYTGVRISMDAHVSTATVKLQLDINFGDPITPAPVEIDYPGLREGTPSIPVLGYPLVTVIAEKVSTAVDLVSATPTPTPLCAPTHMPSPCTTMPSLRSWTTSTAPSPEGLSPTVGPLGRYAELPHTFWNAGEQASVVP